ncbi:hypothetical protein SAMN06265795_10838 [Noviherbaspirillum humi]|uniref:Uncharacterized protein n=1 Tax=Noviherbaspirillum humi TaxID=1688639 RepID=A0A239I1D2_9BURK|nr:hypothetical protein [Noviherbaspirillum humi]SNS86863.1 hypothetical protein SAMN06265795_10838 [Noviherbaspirillum humi]
MTTLKTVSIDGDTYELSDEFLSHVLELAVEGGSSYWADASGERNEAGGSDRIRDFDLSDYTEDEDGRDDEEEDDDDDGTFYTEATFLVAKDPSQGGTLDLEDVADAIERILGGETDVAPAIREIIRAAVETGDPTDIDAEAADCIVQIGLFDEVVYG